MALLDGMSRSHSALQKEVGAAALPAAGFLPTLGATPSAAGLLISQGTAMSVGALYACVTVRAQDVARCTPQLWRKDATGKRILDTEHPLNPVFRQPNQVQTWFEFMEQMEAAYLLRGNGYAAIKRNARGTVFGLIPINPDAVLVLESWNGLIFYNVNRIGLWQIAMLREFPASMASEDILHLRGLSFNALVALSTIAMARDAIGVAMGLEQQVARFIQNGARPSVVLQAKGKLTEAVAQRLKQQWQDFTSGIQNVGKTAVLEDGITAEKLQLSSVDMEMIAQRSFQLEDIARFYRIPPYKLGLEQLRGVNIVQMDQDYVSNTIMPDLHRWEQKFDRTFQLAEQGLEVKLDETVLLRADIATRYNAARIGLLSGFLSPNEVRVGENLPPVPGGDEVFRPLNMAALGSDATGTAPDGAGRPASGELPADGTSGAAPPQDEDDDDAAAKALRRKDAKTLYISRPLKNADAFIEWAKAQGFAKTLTADDLHVTIAFSKAAVDWAKIGTAPKTCNIAATDDGRFVEALGDKGAVVLRFTSDALAARWQELVDLGASWDWPSYKPHVSITYAGGDVDLDAVQPFAGALEFGEEVIAEIDDNWSAKVTEKRGPAFADANAFMHETLTTDVFADARLQTEAAS